MKRVSWMWLAAVVAGCGGVDEAEDAFTEDAEEARIKYDYECRLLPAGNERVFSIHVALRSSTATFVHECGQASEAKYDSSYRPTSRNAGKVRYKTPTGSTVNQCWRSFNQVLMDRTMRSGGITLRNGDKGGFLKVETLGGGYQKLDFICARTTEQVPAPASRTVTIEEVKFTTAELASTLRAANEADEELLVDGGVSTRARNNILEERPFASVEDVAGVSYVGKTALTKLKAIGKAHFAGAAPAPSPEPTPTAGVPSLAQARRLAEQLLSQVGRVTGMDGEDPDAFGGENNRIEKLGGFGSGARLVRIPDNEYVTLAVGEVEERFYIDLFIDGAWEDHGYGEIGETQVFWTGGVESGMVDSDPTMCFCEGDDMKTCHEISGRTFPSSSQMCD